MWVLSRSTYIFHLPLLTEPYGLHRKQYVALSVIVQTLSGLEAIDLQKSNFKALDYKIYPGKQNTSQLTKCLWLVSNPAAPQWLNPN